MSDGRTRAFRLREGLATNHPSCAEGKTSGPREAALRGELAAYRQRQRILLRFGKAGVHNRHQTLRGMLTTSPTVGCNQCQCLGYKIGQGIDVKGKDQKDQPGALD